MTFNLAILGVVLALISSQLNAAEKRDGIPPQCSPSQFFFLTHLLAIMPLCDRAHPETKDAREKALTRSDEATIGCISAIQQSSKFQEMLTKMPESEVRQSETIELRDTCAEFPSLMERASSSK